MSTNKVKSVYQVSLPQNIIDVETINTEEYINIQELYETYKSMGICSHYGNVIVSNTIIPGYLGYHNIMCYRLNDMVYVKKEDADLFKNFVKTFDKKTYIVRGEVANLLEISVTSVCVYDRRLLTPYKYASNIYYKKEEIQYFIDLKKQTKTSNEIKEIFGWCKGDNIVRAIHILKAKGNKNVNLIPAENHPFGSCNLIKGYEDIIKYFEDKNNLNAKHLYH